MSEVLVIPAAISAAACTAGGLLGWLLLWLLGLTQASPLWIAEGWRWLRRGREIRADTRAMDLVDAVVGDLDEKPLEDVRWVADP